MGNITNTWKCLLLVLLIMFVSGCGQSCYSTVGGDLKVWHKVAIDFAGPNLSETSDPNPFTDYRLDVAFSNNGTTYMVPGFYAADGNAANTGADAGNLWRVYFVPDKPGKWTYTPSFRKGKDIAVSLDPDAGTAAGCDGRGGQFYVAPADALAAGFAGKGMLKYVGEHYLQFAGSGEYFIKGGVGSPENFLAYEDFDGTHDAGGTNFPALGENQLHGYAPHAKDWRKGDPSWQGNKGKEIIGAVNYIADKGLNSVYIVTMNVKGDGQDVWPWVTPDNRTVFDISKLAQWEIVFDHMDSRGMMKDILFTETENESLFEASDGGEFDLTRKLYYREMIARFGHHLAVSWNLGEENGHDGTGEDPYKKPVTDAQRKAFCDYIRMIDPYDHHIVVHNWPGDEAAVFGPLLGYKNFEGISLQEDVTYYDEVLKWVDASASAGRKWVVAVDEPLGWEFGLRPDDQDAEHDDARTKVLWPCLFAGGAGVDWYFGWQNNAPTSDLSNEDWRSREKMWEQTKIALYFFNTYLPFAEMRSANELSETSDALVFAKESQVYALYMKKAVEIKLDLGKVSGEYSVGWYNPRTGGELMAGTVTKVAGPGTVSVGLPHEDIERDWVVLIRR